MLKRIRKIWKKTIAVLFVISMSLSSYAAIVSDNDGSAFVTKAEFEALKADFSSQVDDYNDSIDGKIDGAISAYLAGIRLSEIVTADIINKSWTEISSINGVLNNTYKVPDVNLNFMIGTIHEVGADGPTSVAVDVIKTDTGYYFTSVHHYSSLRYREDWSTNKNCYRNLVYCTGSSPIDVGDIIWDGMAVRYRESWYLTRAVQKKNHWSYLDRFGDETFAITMSNLSTLKSSGYVTNWDNVKTTAWPIKYKWEWTVRPAPASGSGGSGSADITFTADEMHDNFRTTVTLDADDNGVKKIYEHVINYKGDTEWRVSNPNWLTLLNASPESTIKSSNLKSAATLSQSASALGTAYHVLPHQSVMDEVPVAQNITDDSVLPSIGLFATKRRADIMYQDNNIQDIEVATNKTIHKDRPKLHQGFQLLAAKEDDKITWEPEFSYTHVHNGTSTYIDNSHEVDIYFSNGPFSDDTTTTKKIKVKVDGNKTEKDYATTTGRKCKIEFDMPKDGIVYVKWVPHFTGTSYLDSDWIVRLDLSKCNSYTYVRE